MPTSNPSPRPTFQLENDQDRLSLKIIEFGAPSTPAHGDAHLQIAVRSASFSGEASVWVAGSSLRQFAKGILALEASRQGTATLMGISPNLLSLTVRSLDSLGHMIVEGFVGACIFLPNSRAHHALHFGMELDPSQLEPMITFIEGSLVVGDL